MIHILSTYLFFLSNKLIARSYVYILVPTILARNELAEHGFQFCTESLEAKIDKHKDLSQDELSGTQLTQVHLSIESISHFQSRHIWLLLVVTNL